MKTTLDPIIPYDFSMDAPEKMLDHMRRIKSEYGIRRFLITGVGIGVRISGYPDDDLYRQLAESIRYAKEQTAGEGFEIGWWCAPAFETGNSTYQHFLDMKGKVAPVASCPLDERLSDDLARRVALVAKIARPSIIQFEDDFEMSNHYGFSFGFGCFCPLHLAEFARRTGRSYSREELEDLFTRFPAEARPLRREFALMGRDTMVDLARKIRKAVDEVAPETRMSLCEPGTTDTDGGLSEPVARALAGPDTRPMIRVFGASYSSIDTGRCLPGACWHTMYSAEHLPGDFELIHETDTYPHTRYYASASYMRSLLYATIFMGCDNTLLYATQYLDDPVEETAYFEMWRDEASRLRAFQESLGEDKGRLVGCHIAFQREAIWTQPATSQWSPSANCAALAALCGRMAIPYTTKDSPVTLLAGTTAAAMTDEQIESVLSKGVLLDAKAAQLLIERGFGDLLGVDVTPLDELKMSEEYVLPVITGLKGRRIYNYAFAPAGCEHTQYARLTLQGAEAVTEYRDPCGNSLQTGMTRFVNRLGGRVVVMGCNVQDNDTSNLYCYRKKEVLRQMINWLGDEDLPAVVRDVPNFWLLARLADNQLFLLLTNLTGDPLSDVKLALAPAWRGTTMEELDKDGVWQSVAANWLGNGDVVLPGVCSTMVPRMIRFRK